MAFALRNFNSFDSIVIQCHDNPDADTLGSGYALWWYLKKLGKSPRLIYGGRNPISKSNLLLMTDNLHIPVEYVEELDYVPNLLITVDCQYNESNVTHFDAENIAIIDHHQLTGDPPKLSEVKSNYGSCSTVMFELLQKEKIDINENPDVATALYYGLMTDTGNFAEISHPADKDLRDYARFSQGDILMFRNANISREELQIAGDALKNAIYDDTHHYGVIEALPCDPNILGLIGDMFLEVDILKCCIIYTRLPFGVKISVRSCVKEVKASELASYLTEGFGGGGGHLIKAGGLLNRDLLEKAGIEYSDEGIRNLIQSRMRRYFTDTEIIYAGNYTVDLNSVQRFRKLEVPVGYVKATDLAETGDKIMIRTLEGDVDVTVEDDLYIILGIDGEIYPCREKRFENSYRLIDIPYDYPAEYPPTVLKTLTGERIEILPFAKSCVTLGGKGIYARELDHRVKVFTSWDPEKYYLGVPGDYLAMRADDLKDVYVIAKDIFVRSYEAIGE
ncbi:MAG: DHH family phosphoesterase [Lachnospiraceae bacterium]|nr:DHH family phosphoesterase [Lachnospiraceae bacterium]